MTRTPSSRAAAASPPGSDPAKPLDVAGDVGDAAPELSDAKSKPQWLVLLQPLTVDTPDRDPVTYDAGRCVRLPAPRARAMIDARQARAATARDLAIGAAQARDLCPPPAARTADAASPDHATEEE